MNLALMMNLATCEALLGHSVRFVVLLVKDLAMKGINF